MKSCVVCGAVSNVGMFLFPKNERDREKWCVSLGLNSSGPAKTASVCFKHFLKSHVMFSGVTRQRAGLCKGKTETEKKAK